MSDNDHEEIPERLARITTCNHLAVFALALSVSNIKMAVSGDNESLEAMKVAESTESKRPFPQGSRWQAQTGSVETASGFELKARIHFGPWSPDFPRVFPSAFDIPILGEDSPKTVVSSGVKIERSSPIYATVATILGITAVHTATTKYNQPEFDTLNEHAGLDAFRPLLDTIEEIGDGRTDFAELEDKISSSTRVWRPSPGRETHFSTPKSLGVPDHIMDRARTNYSILASQIKLLTAPEPES